MSYEENSFFTVPEDGIDATKFHCLLTLAVPITQSDAGSNVVLRLWESGGAGPDTYLNIAWGGGFLNTNNTPGDTSSSVTTSNGGQLFLDGVAGPVLLNTGHQYFWAIDHDRNIQYSQIDIWLEE